MFESSPRPWGCFLLTSYAVTDILVFPTPVGVFLSLGMTGRLLLRLPHARGGVSSFPWRDSSSHESSPRPWGCFQSGESDRHYIRVFPTPVGVFPHGDSGDFQFRSLPHARGGVSPESNSGSDDTESSPRPWGCFSV